MRTLDDTLIYSLGGDDADSFDIDGSSGQLSTKAELDYETKSSYCGDGDCYRLWRVRATR